MVDVEVRERAMPSFEIISNQGIEEMDVNLKDMLSGIFGQQKKSARCPWPMRSNTSSRKKRTSSWTWISSPAWPWNEPSRWASSSSMKSTKLPAVKSGHGPDVSREGVQRDILPIIEGTTVNTRYGMIRTDHILFIAAGAFHITKPSDLIPGTSGPLPIRVEIKR